MHHRIGLQPPVWRGALKLIIFVRLECELPETPERFQDNASTWSDANAAIPSIEERLVSLERGMGEMIHLMRQMVNHWPNAAGSPNLPLARSNSIDDAASSDYSAGPPFTLKPAQFIRDLQIEYFGERDQFSPDANIMGDAVSQGIVDAKLSLKLIELYAFRTITPSLTSAFAKQSLSADLWIILANGSP